MAAGDRPVGAIASAAALLILLLGPPGYGIARRTQVLGVAVLLGAAGALGAVASGSGVLVVALLLLAGGGFAVARRVDRATATVAIVPPVGLLLGVASGDAALTGGALLLGAVVGGLYLLVLDRVWPSPEHPAVCLEGRAGRLLPALVAALPAGYVLASAGVDWHMAAYAFALLAVLVILNARASAHATRHELAGFLAILAVVVAEVLVPVRSDVMVFTAIAIAVVGAWRADRGVVPLWSILGTLLVLIATGS